MRKIKRTAVLVLMAALILLSACATSGGEPVIVTVQEGAF